MHFNDERKTHDAGDWRDIALEIEVEFVVERHADHIRWPCQEKRVTICGRSHDCFSADVGASTRAVLHYELLAEPLRQPLTHQARDNVGRTGRSERHDDAHRPRGIGLRRSDPRVGRQRGSTRGQMQEFATGKFHSIPSLKQRRRDALHSALMLAALMIGHHLSISASWRARSLSGACSSRGTTWSPRSTSRWRVAGAARAATIAALSLPMTCFGVPFGAQIALQTEV